MPCRHAPCVAPCYRPASARPGATEEEEQTQEGMFASRICRCLLIAKQARAGRSARLNRVSEGAGPASGGPTHDKQSIPGHGFLRGEQGMNSFRLTAVGTLAHNPELCAKGEMTFARFCLVGHEPASLKDEPDGPRETIVTEPLVPGVRRHRHEDRARRPEGRPTHTRGENRRKPLDRQARGSTTAVSTFIVTGFRFGAKRGDNGPAAASPLPPRPPDEPAARSGPGRAGLPSRRRTAASRRRTMTQPGRCYEWLYRNR